MFFRDKVMFCSKSDDITAFDGKKKIYPRFAYSFGLALAENEGEKNQLIICLSSFELFLLSRSLAHSF
jgi:hypothetical protein